MIADMIADSAVFILSTDIILLLFLILLLKKDKSGVKMDVFPMVSILIAARNEEENLERLFESLNSLNYPKEKLEILVGDDHSEDRTAEIIKNSTSQNHRINYVGIEDESKGILGKANVLAQLANLAKGDYFLITDADVEVPPTWIEEMISSFEDETGMVNGTTRVSGNGSLAILQDLEWLFAIGKLKALDQTVGSVTGIGNNMCITRKAYEKIGGYENIPFSLTEDHALFKSMVKNDFMVRQKFSPESLASTQAEGSFSSLMTQRRRWMEGASELPFLLKLILVLEALSGVALTALFVVNPFLAVVSYFLLIFFYFIYVWRIEGLLKIKTRLAWLLIFPFYQSIVTLSGAFYSFWPSKVEWKGRKY